MQPYLYPLLSSPLGKVKGHNVGQALGSGMTYEKCVLHGQAETDTLNPDDPCCAAACLIVLGSALNGSVGGEASALPPTLSVRPAVTPPPMACSWIGASLRRNIVSRADGTTDVQLPGTSQTAQPGAPAAAFFLSVGRCAAWGASNPAGGPGRRDRSIFARPIGACAVPRQASNGMRPAIPLAATSQQATFQPAASVQPAQSSAGEPVSA